jgi:hypothetical protein
MGEHMRGKGASELSASCLLLCFLLTGSAQSYWRNHAPYHIDASPAKAYYAANGRQAQVQRQ